MIDGRCGPSIAGGPGTAEARSPPLETRVTPGLAPEDTATPGLPPRPSRRGSVAGDKSSRRFGCGAEESATGGLARALSGTPRDESLTSVAFRPEEVARGTAPRTFNRLVSDIPAEGGEPNVDGAATVGGRFPKELAPLGGAADGGASDATPLETPAPLPPSDPAPLLAAPKPALVGKAGAVPSREVGIEGVGLPVDEPPLDEEG